MSGITGTAQGKLGKYDLRGTLGRGAMGTVYDGWDPVIARRVAIKTVRLSDDDDEETTEGIARFKREAQAAGRLSHPNIVGVYDYGETGDLAYIVMEFVEGRSLKALIDQQRRLEPLQAAEIMTQVLGGLAYSHARGVIHRDIKPANIMLTTENQVKIADFGIARIESSNMTSVGTVMGTPAYMPPEQFLGEPVDARSDIYAAGVMLYHLLTGERPYEGNMASITHRKLSADPPPAPSARGVPAAFDPVVARAMARQPADRFADARSFSEAIRTALITPPEAETADEQDDVTIVLSKSPSMPPAADDDATIVSAAAPAAAAPSMPASSPAPRPATSGPKLAVLGGAAVILLGGAAAAVFLMRPDHPPPAPAPVHTAISTPTPAAVTPQPKPAAPHMTLMNSRALVAASLPLLSCSTLALAPESADATDLALTGLIGTGEPERAARGAISALPGGQMVRWNNEVVPDLYCAALTAIGQADATTKLGLTLNGVADKTVLEDSTPIVPRLVLPDFPSWLTVAYLSNDGTWQPLYPELGQTPRLHKAAQVLTLTTLGKNGVGPPYGRDMVIAIASSERITVPAQDQTMASYLGSLLSAVRAEKAHGARIAASAIIVDTRAKSSP
jgi:serine/threonine-protein kinase